MSDKESLLSKYPYLGYSQNLIECFLILGYEENNLPQIIEEYKRKNNNIYSPSVLSSIISNKDYGLIDNDFIISQIFPYYPNIIINQNNSIRSSIKDIPQKKKIIYSFLVDSQDGKKKLFYTCFGYIFHEKYHYNSYNNSSSEEDYYIPKAFCIISQYSFFSFFDYICNNLNNLINNHSAKVPLEIIIYNIVNFLPTPLNYSLNFDLFNNEIDAPSYIIPQLSGYPYLDFDLNAIFNILPLNLMIEIFLLTVIEQSILFFSSDLEILNMVMFIMYSLNYPINNSTYFWHIVSISKQELNDDNRFVSQIMSSLLGVNASYDESINTNAFGDYHFIVDIDKKKIIYKEYNNIDVNSKKESEKINKVSIYIKNVIKDKNIESAFLYNFIDELKKDLEDVLSKEDFGNQKNKKEINFFSGGKKYNKLIQECFYNFILNILIIFYQNIKLDISYNKIKFQSKSLILNIKDENENQMKLSDEELLFCEYFKSTSKYKLFFETFIQECEPHELYKIPLIFTEEFINVKIRCIHTKNQLKVSFLNIIDNLYISSNIGTLNININNFYFQYNEDKLQDYFIEPIIQSKENIIFPQNDFKLFTFNRNILHKYINLVKNHYDKIQLKKIFPFLYVKKESIHLIDRKTIIQTIQNSFEKNNVLKTSNYLIYALIYIYSILMPFFSYEKLLITFEELLFCIKQLDFFLRYYSYIIIETFFKYYLINCDKNNILDMNGNIYFYLFINNLKDLGILPNEEIFLIKNNYIDKEVLREKTIIEDKNNNIEKGLVAYNHQNINLDLKDKSIFQMFMKYNFCYKGIYKPSVIIKFAMKETGNYNLAFKDESNKSGNNDKKGKTTIIVIKF